MGLVLHLGPSGSGKSERLYKSIFKEAAAEPGRSFLIIVPEQFTLQTQRDIIAMHDKHGIMNIDVLSFPRMAHRIFGEVGRRMPVVLEDTGKSMIVKKVALDKRDELSIYAGKVGKQGFIDEMKSVIAEFYQYGIDEERYEQMLELTADKPQLRRKLNDIGVIYRGFREFTDGRFLMNEELLDSFCDVMGDSGVLRDACVCFDGFTGFTTSQLHVIRTLMKYVRDIHVTLTIDPRDTDRALGEEDLFFLSFKTVMALEKLADEQGFERSREIVGAQGVPYRFAEAPAIAAIEHNIFRDQAEKSKAGDDLCLLSCDSPAGEIRYVIAEIERLVNEEGMRYRDIAVVTGDLSTYSRLADREFTRAGIPFFIDEKRNIVGTAPVEMIRAAIGVAENDFSYDSVFRFVKTGLSPVDSDMCSKLENYCLACGIRGRRMWERTWERAYHTRYTVDLGELNNARRSLYEALIVPVTALKDKDATVAQRLDAIKQMLTMCNVEELLAKSAEALAMAPTEAERLRAGEESQLYGSLMKVFERIGMLLGDDVISLKEFREILDTGFKEAKLALTPAGNDSILIGDIERSRLNAIKVLFFIGVNDGVIPKTGSDSGLLSDSDRTVFEEHDIELSPTKRRSTYLNEFYLYLNMTKPSKRLYVSYYRMTADKKTGRPAYIIALLTKLFDGLEVRNIYSDAPELLKGSDHGVGAAAALVRDKKLEELSIAERTVLGLLQDKDKELYARIVAAACYTPGVERLTEENAAKLYHNVLTGSVSLLEKYASCAFAHFLSYGMRLEERREYEIGGLELGNIYHKALELYCLRLKENGVLWHDTDEELRKRYASECLSETLKEYEDLLNDSERAGYVRKRLERVLNRTVEVLDTQVKAGSFEPRYFEESFYHASSFMKLSGKIDRMDICEADGRQYLRVIDYKSGTKKFDLCRLFYGLQIQLGVYMNEGITMLREKGAGDVTPAGIYYYNIDDPYVDVDKPTEAAGKIALMLRLNGPSNDDPRMLGMNDRVLVGGDPEDHSPEPPERDAKLQLGAKSMVVTVQVKKKQEDSLFTKNSMVMTTSQFKRMGEFLNESMHRMGSEIMAGDASVSPYRMKKENACKYCAYKGVCGFDRRLGYRYRDLKAYKEDDIWQKLNGAPNSNE